MGLIAATRHWAPAGLGMLLFGIGWVAASSTAQAAAQLVCPPWVRARALAIYQLAFNGALAVGSLTWGVLGDRLGLQTTMAIAAILAAAMAVAVRAFGIEAAVTEPEAAPAPPVPEAPAAGNRRRAAGFARPDPRDDALPGCA